MLNPGLPLGLNDILSGYKKKTIQVLLVVFSPITPLLLRLQHQTTLTKRENTLEMQHEYDMNECNKLTLLHCKC